MIRIKITAKGGVFHGSRHYDRGETLTVNEKDSLRMFADRLAIRDDGERTPNAEQADDALRKLEGRPSRKDLQRPEFAAG